MVGQELKTRAWFQSSQLLLPHLTILYSFLCQISVQMSMLFAYEMYNKQHTFKMYNLMSFDIPIYLQSHHHNQDNDLINI